MKSVALFVAGLIVGGIVVSIVTVSRVEVVPTVAQPVAVVSEIAGAVRYNCELSGGVVENGACVCSIEEFQTQDQVYDKTTGFCQSTIGGPAGDAFAASIGLPRGAYAFWNNIVIGLCEKSGGYVSGASCQCSTGTSYDKVTGTCHS